jgi:hypothetical protein
MHSKFALHNLKGNPTTYYLVESEAVSAPTTPGPKASHHIAILDVSGSMYGDMEAVRSTVEKVFTAQEFNDPSQLISLITYSSNPDCRVHFSRITVADVLAPGSLPLREIRSLHTRGLTCISQALEAAEELIHDDEITAISLHSDGYANDPSPFAESQRLLQAAREIAAHPNVFCNTVAYRSSCDFALLTAVANQLSGKCVQATSAKGVYDALVDSQRLLGGRVAPTVEVGLGSADFVTFVSKKARKILGGTASLMVRGLSADDDMTAYRYRRVDEAAYAASPASENDLDALLAFCRSNIALGNLNPAKYAMITTRIPDLIGPHVRAMVNAEVASWALAVETLLFRDLTTPVHQSPSYGLSGASTNTLAVLDVLAKHKGSLRVHMPTLLDGYKRRGVKRIPGTRESDGSVTKPDFSTKLRSKEEWVPVSGVEINRDTATVNLRLVQDVDLVDSAGTVIPEVAGIKLDLKDFKNYTLVSDGQVNVGRLQVRTSDKRCFSDLKSLGVAQGDFDPNQGSEIHLADLPLVDYDRPVGSITAQGYDRLLKLTVLQKILNGISGEASEVFTSEQIVELKRHYLTPALYFSPPTTTAHADLKAALAAGEVDVRTSYKVKMGIPSIRSVAELYSGNAYLQRRFTFTGEDGKAAEKPLLSMFSQKGVWGIKALSSRTKLDEIDALTYPIYAEVFGLDSTGALKDLLSSIGVDSTSVLDALAHRVTAPDKVGEVLLGVSRQVDAAIEAIYSEDIIPLAFYVGATGLVPDALGAKAMTPDDFVSSHPAVKLSKDEKEAMFYALPGGLVLSVFTSAEHFTTDTAK